VDYEAGVRVDPRDGERIPLLLPRSDVVAFELASGSRIVARPSGTEPKAKFYFDAVEPVGAAGAVDEAFVRARARLEALAHAFTAVARV
jgi:phosphomannomutase